MLPESRDADAPGSNAPADQSAPDVRLNLVDGNSDLHSVCVFENDTNEQGRKAIVKKAAKL